MQELKRRRWEAGLSYYSRADLDWALVVAAREASENGVNDAGIAQREAALASLHRRRAKLTRELELISATIASMERP